MKIVGLIFFWVLMLIIDWEGTTIWGVLAKLLLWLVLLTVMLGLLVVYVMDPKGAMGSPTYWVILVMEWLCVVCLEHFDARGREGKKTDQV